MAGTDSPCSRRSAKTLSAKICARAMASSRVWPYAKTPGNAGISVNQRPSSSCSTSIVKGIMLCSLLSFSRPSHLVSDTTTQHPHYTTQDSKRHCQVNEKSLSDTFPLRKAEGLRIAKILEFV